ncbi:Rid family detoxifying hydrolase [Sulfuracidifex metallicus]|uniref:Rid family detoxifying hydrolase n=1 Tax=Sulfuracidifex metallicus TaxID=47303 RepID=UPI00227529D8|nr:Rid family detoxifying hydrolase [Sulfuracidifex metallicus]MCY0849691.1 Rid family detoxifying hydrolase [Sulfuracidifex metallicus]
MKEIIYTEKAPKPIGPYSQAVKVGDSLYVSGQLPIDQEGKMPSNIKEQTEQSLMNVKAILEEAGYMMSDVVMSLVYITDMGKFSEFNEVYSKYFPPEEKPPARITVEVKGLPKGALIEIGVIAQKA